MGYAFFMQKSRKWIKILSIILAVFWTLGISALLSGTVQRRYIYPQKYSEFVSAHAENFGISKSLVFAVIKAESNFNKRSESKKGAKGLMQITAGTAEFIAERMGIADFDIFDADTNIRFGTYYLKYLFSKFKVQNTAIAAYNAGEGNVSEWLKNSEYSADGETLNKIPFEETDKYVKKVEKYRKKYSIYHRLEY